MINKYIKLVIAFLLTLFGAYLIYDRQTGNGIMVILLSFVVLFLYFRNEILLLIFLKMRKQDMEGSKKLLDKIKNPKSALIKSQEAYFYYLRGLTESQNNMNKAEGFFKKAIKTGLAMDYDIAGAKLNLAGAALAKGRKREAQMLLAEAKKLDSKGMMKDHIKMLNDNMKKANVSTNPRQAMMQRKGRYF